MQVELVLAPNPGPFTGPGTNTYVITSAQASVVVDPGPLIASHGEAIERALGTARPLAVLVTHTHPDHAPAANPLARAWGVPALGFAPGPEFEPTATLGDGDIVEVGDVALVALHTPGHTADHLCYRVGDVLFTGDHIMGGSSVIIEDVAAYMASLHKVRELDLRHLYPGHGPELPDASAAISAYIGHRIERERQIVEAVGAGASTAPEIVAVVYGDVDASLIPAASHQVAVQISKLVSDGTLRVFEDEIGIERVVVA